MRLTRLATYSVLFALLISCTSSKDARQQDGSTQQKVTELLSDIPANNQSENEWLYSELISTGPNAIRDLINMLRPPGHGSDTQARFALNGLAKYVTRPGAEAERKMYERIVLDELKSDHHPAAKVFLMEQIELTGSDQAVPVLASFIGVEPLHESAVHALKAINTGKAEQVLLDAINQTDGKQRLVVIKSLGDMEVKSAAQTLIPLAASGDLHQQHAVLYALAQTGNPVVKETLETAIETEDSSQRYFLLFAERLAEEDYSEESAEICRNVLAGDFKSNVRSSALTILTSNLGEEASEQLLSATIGADSRLRSKALSLLVSHPDWQIWDSLINGLDEYPVAVQAEVITALGQSKKATVQDLRPYLNNSDRAVRSAAAQSLILLNDNGEVLDLLLDRLVQAKEPDEIQALKKALLQLPTKRLTTGIAEILPGAPDQAKIILIEILADRKATDLLQQVLDQRSSSNPKVRIAVYRALDDLAAAKDLPKVIDLLPQAQNNDERSAIQEAIIHISSNISNSEERTEQVVRALDRFQKSNKKYLYGIFADIGGQKALSVVVEASQNSDEEIKYPALEALANWKSSAAIQPLFNAFQKTPESKRMPILHGYVRIITESKYSDGDKIGFLTDILENTSQAEEQVQILKGFSEIKSSEALSALIPYFSKGDSLVKEQSFRSAANVLFKSASEPDQMLSVLEAAAGSGARDSIEQHLQELKMEIRESNFFTRLFNGKDLTGWTGDKDSYVVEDGQLVSVAGASGNLFTEEEYSDFILRFEFKLTPGANNGLGIRSPLEGNPAYEGIELQILDNRAEQYADLDPYQYHGSVYGVVPADRGHLNPAGEWNTQEVIAEGSNITVKLNGHTILDADLEEAGTPETRDGKQHPGLLRKEGHIGFLAHGDQIALRDIRIRDLTEYLPDYSLNSSSDDGMNQPPEGFRALFNGENLEGWKGLVGNPESRAEMSEEELAKAQKEADKRMQKHWSVKDGILYFDGEGESLVTKKRYKDFEMLVDWKIEPGGDSGIYLRGSPQVQIWDVTEWPQGSGGLYNNQNHRSEPLVAADNAIGEWNTMRIKMIGEKVTVHLNNQLVVPNVVLENYWNRDKPIYSEGQIELQSHNTPLYFKNIFIREIPRQQDLFNGKDLTGWQRVGGDAGKWLANNGVLYTEGGGEKWKKGAGGGWLSTIETYDNFKLQLEYKLPKGGNSGIFFRAPHEGDPAYQGLEIQLLDDAAAQYSGLDPWQYTGSIYYVKAPSTSADTRAGEWQDMEIIADGPKIKVILNGKIITNMNLVDFMDRVGEHPGLKRRSGHIGLQNHNSRVEFRNIKVTEIN